MTSNPNDNDSLLVTVIEALNVCEGNGVKTLLETVLNAAMRAERDKALNATIVWAFTVPKAQERMTATYESLLNA